VDGAVKKQYTKGFCETDASNVTIPILYSSIPKVNQNDKHQEYMKRRNICDYPCIHNNKSECKIFKDALEIIII
jgi:hypothetical protein